MPGTRPLRPVVAALALTSALSCEASNGPAPPRQTDSPTSAASTASSPAAVGPGGSGCASSSYAPQPAEQERDAIFTLLAMAIALKGWQSTPRRGHNIAAVLVDPSHRPVCWGRNASVQAGSRIQHAETRVMQSYLAQSPQTDLAGYSLYTTLEPCVMCSGTMLVSGLAKVIYAQGGGPGGRTIEVLNCRRARTGMPRLPLVKGRARFGVRSAIDANQPPDGVSWRQWRYGDATRKVFASAGEELASLHVTHPANAVILQRARRYLERVPADYRELPYSEACGAAALPDGGP